MDKIKVFFSILWVLFFIALAMIAIYNKALIKSERKKILKKINNLSKIALKRKIVIADRTFTCQQIKDNPALIEFLTHEDLEQFTGERNLFSERESNKKNEILRKVYNLPEEALQRKVNLPSGLSFFLSDFKQNSSLRALLSESDFKALYSERGLYRLRLNSRMTVPG